MAIEEAFKIELSDDAVADEKTIGDFARVIEQHRARAEKGTER